LPARPGAHPEVGNGGAAAAVDSHGRVIVRQRSASLRIW
jgi:hypothetical protein